ncbi:protein-L-isoaspartate O-methyltransferase [Kitasatospora sp. NPDC058048]|uniref:protein-L-isoaspartate O-methyltransferase family protein n=1 Tax=Kitasatospora sp. NPDC058048 TaxID=3346313 RepID=UPI0036DA425E
MTSKKDHAQAAEAPTELPEALAAVVRPGDRVLQIGPGTSAIGLAERTRRPVTSVHRTPADADAVRAPLGPRAVDAQVGDLFEGRPDAAPYDLIVVTAGVRGLSPRWLDQLAPGGAVVAPVALGGLHPWLLIGPHAGDGLLYGRVLAVDPPDAGPPPADGRLYETWPAATDDEPPVTETAPPRWLRPLPPRFRPERYGDLWAWLAGQDDRITAATVTGTAYVPGCALVVGTSAVHVRPTGLWVTDTEAVTLTVAEIVAEHVQRWLIQDQPAITEMTCRVDRPPTARADDLLVAAGWTTSRPVDLPR